MPCKCAQWQQQVVRLLAAAVAPHQPAHRSQVWQAMAPAREVVRRLHSNSRLAQLKAAKQLADLTQADSHVCSEVVDAGGIPALLQLLRTSSYAAVQAAAARVLGNVAELVASVREEIVSGGAIPHLTALLRQGSSSAQSSAALALGYLGADDDARKAAILAAGAVGPLVQLLSQSQDTAVLRAAMEAVHQLAKFSVQCGAAIADAGAIPALVQLIQKMPVAAMNALIALGWSSSGRREAAVAAGMWPALERRLLSGGCDAAANRALVLAYAYLSAKPGSMEAAAIPTLVKCLTVVDTSAVGVLLRKLAHLAQSGPTFRAAMIKAGLMQQLQLLQRRQSSSNAGIAAAAVQLTACLGEGLQADIEDEVQQAIDSCDRNGTDPTEWKAIAALAQHAFEHSREAQMRAAMPDDAESNANQEHPSLAAEASTAACEPAGGTAAEPATSASR